MMKKVSDKRSKELYSVLIFRTGFKADERGAPLSRERNQPARPLQERLAKRDHGGQRPVLCMREVTQSVQLPHDEQNA